MFEVPKSLLNKWNRKLKKEGLGARLKPAQIELTPLTDREALTMIIPDVQEPFVEEFLALENDKLQKDIIFDLQAKKDSGMQQEELIKRLQLLVKYAHY